MKKITMIIVMAMLCLNFNVSAQVKYCNTQSVSKYKWGFSNYKYGFEPKVIFNSIEFGQMKRLMVYNKTLLQMFAIALKTRDNNVIIHVKHPERLNIKYCYELQVPADLRDNMYVIMHQNLNYEYPEYSVLIDNGKLVISDKGDDLIVNNDNTY